MTAAPRPEPIRPAIAPSPQDVSAWRAWSEAAARPGVDAALRDLFRRLDESVRDRGPVCWASGRCCHFDAFGHRLYVTALEVAWVLQEAKTVREASPAEPTASLPLLNPRLVTPHTPKASSASDPAGCPFQIETLCSIHTVRPLGCRVFFCQRGTEGWQHELYETFLGELRALHDAHVIDYRYLEWRAGIAEMKAAKMTR